MKVKLGIVLDLPNDIASFSDAELAQLLFDEYVNYATCSHLRDATHWCCKARIETENEDPTGKMIYEDHCLWGEICGKATWEFERK